MFTRLWRGEINLAFVFWVLGVLISPLFLWITFQLGKFLPGAWSMLMILVIWLLYGVIISLIIWRSSKKYTGRKVWSILSRIAICTAWVTFLGIGFGVFYFIGFDFFTTSYTIGKKLKADPAYPYIGFWKNDCSDNFGLAIEKAVNGEYYVRFCGPGGCFGKTSFMFMRTKLINDPRYKILDNDTIGLNVSSVPRGLNPEEEEILKQRMKNGLLIYKRCNPRDMASIVSMEPKPSTVLSSDKDNVTIVRIEPKKGTVLSAASKLQIKATLKCNLVSGKNGKLCMTVQDQGGKKLVKEQKCSQVPHGINTVSLEEDVELPPSGVNEIQVFFPLFIEHADNTKTGEYRTYLVR